MIWNLLGCDLCGMLLDRRSWLSGRPRASLLRAGAVGKSKWLRVAFSQKEGRIVKAPDTAGRPRGQKPRGIQTLDICAACARRPRVEIEKDYRTCFPLRPVLAGTHLDEWSD